MTPTKTELLSEKALRGLIDHCNNHRGALTAIVRDLSEMTGQKQWRQNVAEYLHPDPKLRVEPRLGLGLALLLVGEKMLGPVSITRRRLLPVTRNGCGHRTASGRGSLRRQKTAKKD